MKTLILVKITRLGRKWEETRGQIDYQALTEQELDSLYDLEGSYSYIEFDIKVEKLGQVLIPSISEDE